MTTEDNDPKPDPVPDTPKGLFDHFNSRFDSLETRLGADPKPPNDDPPSEDDPPPKDDPPDPQHSWFSKKLW